MGQRVIRGGKVRAKDPLLDYFSHSTRDTPLVVPTVNGFYTPKHLSDVIIPWEKVTHTWPRLDVL